MKLPEWLRKHGGALAAVTLCVAHFATFDISRIPIVTDIRYFLYFSWQVAEGAVPHLDYFENKTELATYAGAALYRAAEIVGSDPLMTIRAGFLTIAGVLGLLLFFIQRTLGGGRSVAGLMGLLAYGSFALLGYLPAIGPIPKLLMSVFASAAALLLYNKRWFWAGVCASLAFMDWQIGGLVAVAALATAFVFSERPLRPLIRVVLGGVAGFAPFACFYLVHGTFVEFLRQVVGASLFRGSAVSARVGFVERLIRIKDVAERACPSNVWLAYLALPGVVVAVWWLWRWRHEARARLLMPLLIYHGGVLLFSAIDFQGYGDFFLLLHTLVLFLGVVWIALYDLARKVTPRAWHAAVGAAGLVVVLAVSRPGPLRPDFALLMRHTPPEMTLGDQREVAAELARRIGDGKVAFMDDAEALFLMRKKNGLPLIYWNLATWQRYRLPQETIYDTGMRLMLSADADALISPPIFDYTPLLAAGYEVVRLKSTSENYAVDVAFRRRETLP